MDLTQARFNMVEQQVRPWDVLDKRVLNLMSETHREPFVPKHVQTLAYADTELPLPCGECMLAPREIGRLLQALQIDHTDLVLQIGIGSGYLTALMAQIADHVVAVELHDVLLHRAEQQCKALDLHNITFIHADAAHGWPQHGPYNTICLTGAVPELQDNFLQSLHIGGRLYGFIGEAPLMQACLYERVDQSQWRKTALHETLVPPLRNLTLPPSFRFE